MILIAVVGLGFVVGMPYLMDSSMFTPLFYGLAIPAMIWRANICCVS